MPTRTPTLRDLELPIRAGNSPADRPIVTGRRSVVGLARIVAVAFGLLLLGPSAGAGVVPGADGIGLSVEPGASAGELALAWTGGAEPYLVFRSEQPAAVVDVSTRIATTAGSSVAVPQGAAEIEFFLVVNVNLSSNVETTSSCLTAGTGAEAAVVVDLRDSLGNPLPGSNVAVFTDQGSSDPVVETAGTYRSIVSAPELGGAPTNVSVTADGVLLATQPVLEVAGPQIAGGAGACPADGNLRVRIVDESGDPLAGANVMLGLSAAVDLFETTPGDPPDGDNTSVTGPDGYVEFRDFGDALDGPQTVTAAAAGRRYVTLVDVDAADLVLPLAEVDPVQPTEQFTGDVTNVPAPSNDPIELAVMLPDVSLDGILSFSASDLLADSECYEAGGVAGSAPLPGNVYIPSQCAVQVFFCLQSLPEHPYTSAPVGYGDRKLLALRGSAPLSALSAGDFNAVLTGLSLNGIGVTDRTAASPGPTALDLPITDTLSANLSCTIDNAPTNADVLCVGAGDWDSSLDPGLTPGAGRLFVTGFRLGDAAGATGPFTISGVTTMTATGAFASIDYLGGAVAQYNDPLEPGIPPGTANGTSAILDRSGTGFDGTGGNLVFDDFFPVRGLARVGRDFSLGTLPGTNHPVPHLNRITLDRVVTENYEACVVDDSTRVRRTTLWEIFVPGSSDTWRLPEPPPGWPRQDAGGDLAGLIDPANTPEDDALELNASTFHLGTMPGFDYDRLQFSDLRLHLTHVTRNEAPY